MSSDRESQAEAFKGYSPSQVFQSLVKYWAVLLLADLPNGSVDELSNLVALVNEIMEVLFVLHCIL
jgi:hypothetical protein